MTTRQDDHAPAKGVTGVLLVCVAAGLTYLVIGVATGQTPFGISGLAIMLAYAAVLVLGRRHSEAIALLAGEVTDERRHDITRRALAFTANVLIAAVLGGFLVSLAMESDAAGIFAGLAAVGALAFLAGIVWNSVRG